MRLRNSIAIPIILVLLAVSSGILTAGYLINKKVFHDVFEERESHKARNIRLAIQSLISVEAQRIAGFAKVLKKDADVVYGLYHRAATRGDARPLKTAMDQLDSLMNLQILAMADPAGNIIYASAGSGTAGGLESFPPFVRALGGEEVLEASRGPDGWALRCVTPVHALGGKRPTGILVLGTRIDHAFARRIAAETGSQIILAASEGIIAASYPPSDPRTIDSSVAGRCLAGGTPVFVFDNGNSRSRTYSSLDIAGEKFCLVIETDIGVVKDLLHRNGIMMAKWGSILFSGITVLGLALTLMLIRPLGRLQDKAREVVREYTGGELKDAPGGNEISTLVRAIHLMVEAMKGHILERTRAEEAHREASRALEALIEASPLAIVVTESSGTVRVWNPAAERILGWQAQEAVGRRNPVLFFPGNEEIEALLATALGGERFSNREVRCRDKGGTEIILAVSAAPLAGDGGGTVGTTAIMADVTESRRAEEALRRSEEQLRQSQKMEAVGKLAGGIAHDFNNLLSVIVGYSELLLGRLGALDPGRREVEQIRKAGERAASLTHQLLAFSRRQVLKPKHLSLNDAVSNFGGMLRRLIGENIEIDGKLCPDIWTIEADPHQIDQVLMNLSVNARDAMPDGGRLTLATDNVVLEQPFVERELHIPPGPYATLEVRDTGCGMDPSILARIFEPFFTTKEQAKGTGLGLATVYGIVKQSGGFIRVQSAPGSGTTFTIYLPKVEEETGGAVDIPSETGEKSLSGKGTILVVEDEDAVRAMACETLRGFGYTVLEARHGEEALSLSDGHEGAIHLLLTDVVMPGMNGLQLATRVKASRPGTPVLFMSGYSEDAVRNFGASVAFIQKPITPVNLSTRIADMFAGGCAS